jgi:hypothetical protein
VPKRSCVKAIPHGDAARRRQHPIFCDVRDAAIDGQLKRHDRRPDGNRNRSPKVRENRFEAPNDRQVKLIEIFFNPSHWHVSGCNQVQQRQMCDPELSGDNSPD